MRTRTNLFLAKHNRTQTLTIQCVVFGSASDWFCKDMGLPATQQADPMQQPIIFNKQITITDSDTDSVTTQGISFATQINPDANFTWFALLPRTLDEAKQLSKLLNQPSEAIAAIPADTRGLMEYNDTLQSICTELLEEAQARPSCCVTM